MGAEILLCLPFWKNQERVDNQRVLIFWFFFIKKKERKEFV